MKDHAVLLGSSKCAVPGPGGEIAKDQIRFTGLNSKKLKHFTGLALPQSQPSLGTGLRRSPSLGVSPNLRWAGKFGQVTLPIEHRFASSGKGDRPRGEKVQNVSRQ